MGSAFATLVPFFSRRFFIKSHNIIMALVHVLFVSKEALTRGLRPIGHMPLELNPRLALNLGVILYGENHTNTCILGNTTPLGPKRG